MNRRLVLYASAALVAAGLAHADTTLLAQDFEGDWPPSGWEVHSNVPPDTWVWHRARDLGDTCWSENPTHFAVLENRPATQVYDTLISPIVDCSGMGSIVLRCSTFVVPYWFDYRASIIGSDDGGVTWSYLVRSYEPPDAFGPGLETLNIYWAGGNPRVRLAWVYYGDPACFVAFWAVDNITVVRGPVIHDAAIDGFDPTRSVDSGAVVEPMAEVRNCGSFTENILARMKIGSDYNETASAPDVAPGSFGDAFFPAWQPKHVGAFAVSCSTELAGDTNPGNDAARDSVKVVFGEIDIRIESPPDTVDSGCAVYPALEVRSLCPDTMRFPLSVAIQPGSYGAVETLTLTHLQRMLATFGEPWVPTQCTRYSVRCSTGLYGSAAKIAPVYVRPFTGLAERLSTGPSGAPFLAPVSPNPGAGPVTLRYAVAATGPVRLRIYTPAGILVRELVSGIRAAGYHEAAWDGRTSAGLPAGPGIYLCRMESGDRTLTTKLVRLR